MAGWADDPRVNDVLDGADVLLLAVNAGGAPHVTPVVFDHDDGELWAVAPRRSVKVRAIAEDDRVGALVRCGDTALMLGGRARLVDPLTGRGLGRLPSPHRLPAAAVGFLTRNERRLSRVVRDHPSPTLALSRVAIRLSVARVTLLDGDAVVATWGDWPAASVSLAGELSPCPPALEAVPSGLRPLLGSPRDDAALGWHSPVGPVALPAQWDPVGMARISTRALSLTGALVAGPACLTAESYSRGGRDVRGVMLRGAGRARSRGASTQVTVAPIRTVWWSA